MVHHLARFTSIYLSRLFSEEREDPLLEVRELVAELLRLLLSELTLLLRELLLLFLVFVFSTLLLREFTLSLVLLLRLVDTFPEGRVLELGRIFTDPKSERRVVVYALSSRSL